MPTMNFPTPGTRKALNYTVTTTGPTDEPPQPMTVEALVELGKGVEQLPYDSPHMTSLWCALLETVVPKMGRNTHHLELLNHCLKEGFDMTLDQVRALADCDSPGVVQVHPCDPRLANFWQSANRVARIYSMCEYFDRYSELIGGPVRVTAYSHPDFSPSKETLSRYAPADTWPVNV